MEKIIKVLAVILMVSGVTLLFLLKPFSRLKNKDTYETLKECFLNPSPEARPKVYWWCLNGNIDTVRAKQEFRQMRDAGLGGFDLFEIGLQRGDNSIPGGPAFLSDESLRLIEWVVEEAGKLGLTVGLNVSSSWNAGGSWTEPQHAGKSLYCSKVNMKGDPDIKSILIPFPEVVPPRASLVGGTDRSMIPLRDNGRPVYYEDVAVLALPAGISGHSLDTASVIDVTDKFNSETDSLYWEIPPGEWDIYRFVCSNSGQQLVLPSPESAGLTVDHFDSTAVKMHFKYVIDRLGSVLGDLRNTALKSLYLASYEARGFVWTPSLAVEFEKLHGYRIEKFLPSFFDAGMFPQEITSKIQADFKKVLSELMIRNLYVNAKNICNSNGLKINCEAGGPGYPLYNGPAEPLKALGALDIPRGEFWVNHSRFYNDISGKDSIDILRVVKEVSAASHIYMKDIVEEEAFTSFQHWQEGPFDIKPVGDRAFCEGMNRVVFHGFSHNIRGSGYPGFVYSAGTHFNDKRVWWPKAGPFIQYLTRLSSLFQEAEFDADVLYYYGDKVPNSATPKNTHYSAGPGYDYEVINTEVLVKDLTTENGELLLPNGARFTVLELESEQAMNPSVVQKLNYLASQGALIAGKNPGIEYSGESGLEVLNRLDLLPDFNYDGNESGLIDFIHYRLRDVDVYFVVNTTGDWISRYCRFRQEDKTPEIWDPVDGTITPVSVFEQTGRQLSVPITLAPYGSLLLVFRKADYTPHYTQITGKGPYPPLMKYTGDGIILLENGTYKLKDAGKSTDINNAERILELTGSWELTFDEEWGAPANVTLNELRSWTESGDTGVKYYSGKGTYRKSFRVDPDFLPAEDEVIYLDLGRLSKVGDVWLNGHHLGIVWSEPYSFDVSGLLSEYENKLVVEIANTWSNRLKGDALGYGDYTSTNIRSTIVAGNDPLVTSDQTRVPWAEVPLIQSGLLGPVRLIKYTLF